jgi:hypothetical protein
MLVLPFSSQGVERDYSDAGNSHFFICIVFHVIPLPYRRVLVEVCSGAVVCGFVKHSFRYCGRCISIYYLLDLIW